MCSTREQRILAFWQAIDELASQAASADALSRLAELWAQLATLDPEVAKRLPTYEG